MRTATIQQLHAAATEREVVNVVREYLVGWAPSELAMLPQECRPGRIRDTEDIADIALSLTRARISQTDPDPVLTDMEAFFAYACTHLSRLESRRQSRRGSESPSVG